MCTGVGGLDLANMSNFGVRCGLVMGPPTPRGNDIDPFRRGKAEDMYTQLIYSCASAAKAVIKTVTFRYNGTDGLASLYVDHLQDKEYATEEEKPLWGVEDSGLDYRDILPLWGLVDPKYEGNVNVSTLRTEHLWPPGYHDYSTSPVDATQNMPGIS